MTLGILIAAIVGGVATIALTRVSLEALLGRSRDTRLLARLREDLGLEARLYPVTGLGGPPRLHVGIDGFSVLVTPTEPGRQGGLIRLSGSLPARLGLRLETVVTRADHVLGARDVLTGDVAFDRTVLVAGDPAVVAAVLDGATRTAVVAALRGGATVEHGAIAWPFRLNPDDTVKELREHLERALTLARLLVEPVGLDRRLAAVARRDPVAGVRRNCLKHLVERFPDGEETARALRERLEDPDEQVRLLAARSLAGEGEEVLVELVRSASAAVAAEAAAALGARLPLADARALLERGHAAADAELIRAAAAALREVGSADDVARLRAAAAALPLAVPLRRAVAAAIDAIQARVTGAAPGQLSLAAAEQGALSLPDDRAGALSVDNDVER